MTDHDTDEFGELVQDLQTWLNDRDIILGSSDTHIGQLALFIMGKIDAALDDAIVGLGPLYRTQRVRASKDIIMINPAKFYTEEEKQMIRDKFLKKNPKFKSKLEATKKKQAKEDARRYRYKKIKELQELGMSYHDIGKAMKLSKQRISQIIKHYEERTKRYEWRLEPALKEDSDSTQPTR